MTVKIFTNPSNSGTEDQFSRRVRTTVKIFTNPSGFG